MPGAAYRLPRAMRRMLLLPAAGRSVRMSGLPKEFLPVGTRPGPDGTTQLPAPTLAHVLDCGIAASIDFATVVTSSAKAPILMDAIANLAPPIPTVYVHQPDAIGLGGAIVSAREQVLQADGTLLLMPDTIIRPVDAPGRALDAVVAGATAAVTLHRHEHPERFGVAILDDAGRVEGFTDKPALPPSNWIWTCAAFSADFLPLLAESRSPTGEWGLTEALDLAARNGRLEAVFVEEGAYLDVGTYDGYLQALRELGGFDAVS